ncbi:MAG: hypothetical protein U0Z26_17745 [Anaerolineales bacterium]
MHHSQKSAIVFPLILIFILTACNSSGDKQQVYLPNTGNTPEAAVGNGSCDNVLYPVKQGATWVYTNTGGPSGTISYTDTISEVHSGGFTIHSQFNGSTRAQEWSCQADGLQAHQFGGEIAANLAAQGITTEFNTTQVSGISILREISSGAQWKYSLQMNGTMSMSGNQQSQANGTYSITMQETGKETITTPAGTFEATRFQENSNIDIIANFDGVDVPIKFSISAIVWYAPGVGHIKSVENGDFGSGAFTSITELQSYSIP